MHFPCKTISNRQNNSVINHEFKLVYQSHKIMMLFENLKTLLAVENVKRVTTHGIERHY